MSIKPFLKILPYFVISWAVRHRGAQGEFHAKDRHGNPIVEKIRLMHVHGGEYIAFSEHAQELYEKSLESKEKKKYLKRKKEIETKSFKILQDINSDDDLRDKVVNDVITLYGKRD